LHEPRISGGYGSSVTPRFASLLVGLGLFLGGWAPVARFGYARELGRIDIVSVHGLSHARVDGLGDPPQVALAGFTAVGAALGVLGVRRAGAAARAGGVVLAALVLWRVGTRMTLGPSLDAGALGLLVLVAAGVLPGRGPRPAEAPAAPPCGPGDGAKRL